MSINYKYCVLHTKKKYYSLNSGKANMEAKYLKGIFTGLAVMTLFGCANMPDAVVNYYLPKSEVNITVTQTVSCVDVTNRFCRN